MKKKTTEQFKKELFDINPNIEIVGEYIGANKYIKAKCLYDDYEWDVKPSMLLHGTKCPVCTNHKVVKGINDISTTRPDLMKYFKNKNDAYTHSHGSECKVSVICPTCGNEDVVKINNISCFGYCCKYCWENTHKKHKAFRGQWNWDNINNYINENAKGYKLIDVKTVKRKNGNEKRICISCPNKNHEHYWVSLYNFQSGYRCQKCAAENPISRGERKAIEVFKKYKIKYIPQHKFDDCKDKHVLPFDFFLPDYNLIIEIMGEQHVSPIKYFGGEEQFKLQVKHDKIKRDYLLKNNIDILDIWYYELNDIENIISNKLCSKGDSLWQ